MQRYYKLIAGGAAVAAAGLLAVATQRGDPPETTTTTTAAASGTEAAVVAATTDAPPLLAEAAPMPPTAPGPMEPPAIASDEALSRIDTLTAELAEREASLAELEATVAARDAALDEATATIAAREAELQVLRDEIASLRDRYAFELELAAMKAEREPTAASPAGEAEAVLTALKGPPPPQPAVLALTQIHFDTGSSRLSPGGQVHAAAAAVMLAEMTVTRIELRGYTDRVGSPAFNERLAGARARAVADYLIAAGVPESLIEASPMGEADLPVATDDGVPEPLNRTVAIVAVPLPTS